MTGLDFQAEFMSGREFGLRVKGEGILLLHRVRAALLALASSGREPGPPSQRRETTPAPAPAPVTRR